jgi:hypothetical protein
MYICCPFTDFFEINSGVLNGISFTDEDVFYLNWVFNRQKSRMLGRESPYLHKGLQLSSKAYSLV